MVNMDTPKPTTSVLIITGTVGVGKSSVANEVFEVLQRTSQPVALINLDEFGYVSPRPADIEKMEAYRQAHPVSPELPGDFDVVFSFTPDLGV